MRKPLLLASAAVAVFATAGIAASHLVASPARAATGGATVDDFQLTDSSLMAQRLSYYAYAPAIVIMSRGQGAYSRAASAELETLAAKYRDKGVLVFELDSRPGASRDADAAEGARTHAAVPVLMDEQQLVGEQLGVKREGEVFVVSPRTWRVAYHGPLDDRFVHGAPGPNAAPAHAYAADAVEALLAGRPAPVAQVEVSAGPEVPFPLRTRGDFAKISYSREVAPILQEKCVSCHLTGGIGPFAMDGYEVVQKFSPMIRETVRTQRMPPYFADPHIGVFKNDQGLTPAQKTTLVHWIEAGAPRGDGPDPLLANQGKVAPEWPAALGKPDVVVELPAFTVPASGVIEYQNPYVANPFTQNTWLRAISIRPGDRRVLHHVVSNWSPVSGEAAPTIPGGSVGSYTPGAEAQVIAEGAGAPVPAGGKLHFQMHYTTMGKPATDVTKVGFYTLKEEPKYIKRSAVIGDLALYIPAGEARHREVAYMTFPADALLYTLYPHAHYRGMHVELHAVTPDGKSTPLLVLPKYDFNWQRDYDPVKPILVKAGTKLVATWVYDNSKYNVANPDPTRNVTWGEQTPDEMMYFRVNYRWLAETAAHPRPDLEAKLHASQIVGSLDANLDGFIEPEELKGPLAPLRAKFDQLDTNHDGRLDAKEMAAVDLFRRGRAKAQTPDL